MLEGRHAGRRIQVPGSESMNEPRNLDWNAGEGTRRRIRLANLEADVAYFQARLEFLGEPATANQRAQRKVFKLLRKSLGDKILKAKRRMVEDG
jgi:hypothetical protein